jgi:hypothetical protein
VSRQFGGDAIYSAMGARIWSSEVSVVSIVNRRFPLEWTAALAAAGIDTAGIRRSALPFGIEARMIYNPDGSRTWGMPSGLAGSIARRFPSLRRALDAWMSLAFSPRADEIPGHYFQGAAVHIAPMAVARQNDCLRGLCGRVACVTLDLLPGYLACRQAGRPDIPELSLANVVLPSEQEITEYFGPISAQEGARRLAELGARVVVVKRGAQGSLLYEAVEQRWRQVPAYPSAAVDTTGAGDAYCGGFLVGLTETGDLLQAALYGTVSASFIIEGFGALHSRLVTRADAEERLARLGGIIQEMG